MRPFPSALASLVLAATATAGGSAPPAQTHVVRTGAQPCGVAVGNGGLWVGVYGAGTLLRLDPRTGRVTRRIPVGAAACRIALAENVAWVTRDRAGVLVRVDLRTGKGRELPVAPQPFDVLSSAGAIWTTSWEGGSVTKIDPKRGVVLAELAVHANPTGLAECGGRIWVGHGRTARQITSVDPKTLRVRRVAVGARPEWPYCIRGAVWVTTPDSVLRLHPKTGRVLSRLRLGETLAGAAAGPDGLVWVSDKQHSVVHRVTPDGRAVRDSFPAGPGAFALARVGRAMWVTSFAGADIRRFEAG